jgi:hypothetical protein
MGRIFKKPKNEKTRIDKGAGKAGKNRLSKAPEEDDDEDGDFATPKRDRTGDDDQPL